jgi:hypothetical protein
MIGFACLDFVTKGIFIMTMLTYTMYTIEQNNVLTRMLKRSVKVYPIPRHLMLGVPKSILKHSASAPVMEKIENAVNPG